MDDEKARRRILRAGEGEEMFAYQDKARRAQDWCMNCCITHHPEMLTGYCLTGMKCDKCGTVNDLAMVVPKQEG